MKIHTKNQSLSSKFVWYGKRAVTSTLQQITIFLCIPGKICFRRRKNCFLGKCCLDEHLLDATGNDAPFKCSI